MAHSYGLHYRFSVRHAFLGQHSLGFCRSPTISSFLPKNFLEANVFALRARQKVRSEFGEPADGKVTIDEHLVALS